MLTIAYSMSNSLKLGLKERGTGRCSGVERHDYGVKVNTITDMVCEVS